MNHIVKKFMAVVMVLGILFTSTGTFAAGVENPLYVSLQLETNDAGEYDHFSMAWKNPEWVKKKLAAGEAVDFEIDGKVNDEAWSSTRGTVYAGQLTKDQANDVKLEIPPESFEHLKNVDIMSNLYSFRVRYKSGGTVSPYSNPIAVGYRPSFSNASAWSKEVLMEASKNGLIPASVKSDMKKEMTRQEFTEVIVRVYEKVNRVHLVAGKSPYRDANNEAVTVATRLGIVQGVGRGKFYPDSEITREDMATIFNRLLTVMNVEHTQANGPRFADHTKISNYAIEPVYKLQSLNIMLGYNDHSFRPKNNASREQGVVMAERVYCFMQEKY
ncbi:MAG: S-layer homology domain-containing protein [Peptoniphilus sp.]|nr:S-layer homology domain-containing protein [Peptoniphilus sp.]MDD7363729.1 S-layer homology domain-containing protein [Bacillota bacterium]MDY6044114.1 S-layer homology domain-containing protein [Peptoniphilus sp.]